MRPIDKSLIKKRGYCAICNRSIAMFGNGIWHHLEESYGPGLYMAINPHLHNAKPIPPGCARIWDEIECTSHWRVILSMLKHIEPGVAYTWNEIEITTCLHCAGPIQRKKHGQWLHSNFIHGSARICQNGGKNRTLATPNQGCVSLYLATERKA